MAKYRVTMGWNQHNRDEGTWCEIINAEGLDEAEAAARAVMLAIEPKTSPKNYYLIDVQRVTDQVRVRWHLSEIRRHTEGLEEELAYGGES